MQIDEVENRRKMLCGELFVSFTPELIAARKRCKYACKRYNNAGEVPRRRLVEMWREITGEDTPLPPPAPTIEEDDKLLEDEPWVEGPVQIDYGTNVRLGKGVYINANCTIVDSCLTTVGPRTMFGPNVSLYSGRHPLDPAIRDGLRGPEDGKEIHIGEDCWIGGNAILLPGVTIGRGSTVGAGSVVTKDVPPFHVVAGNPARIIRKIETLMDPEQAAAAQESAAQESAARERAASTSAQTRGAEKSMKRQAVSEEKLWRAFAASEKSAAEAGVYGGKK